MENTRLKVNSSYSLVLFDHASRHKSIDKFFTQSKKFLIDLSDNDNLLYNFLVNLNISKEIRKDFLMKNLSKKYSKYFLYFIFTIIDFNRCSSLPKIIKSFLQICNDYYKIKYIKVFSAFELTKQQLEKIKKSLEKHYKSKVTLENFIDQSLIGGIRIESETDSIDNTIINKLKTMKHESESLMHKHIEEIEKEQINHDKK